MRNPRHGELQAAANQEAYRIWLTRDTEPEQCVLNCQSQIEREPQNLDELIDARRLFSIMKERMRPRLFEVLEMRYVDEMTFSEIGAVNGFTGGRAQQILQSAERKARRLIEELEGDL